jgi:pyridoxine 4-dehydrogenase
VRLKVFDATTNSSQLPKVIATAKELGIAVHAYSPIGRGMLTGQIKKVTDIPGTFLLPSCSTSFSRFFCMLEGDMRHRLSRFAPENFDQNLKLVEAVQEVAEKKGVTAAQLAIAWVRAQGDHIIPLAGSSKKERTLENLKSANVQLTPQELATIDEILQRCTVKGGRYNDHVPAQALHLWG